MERTLEATPFIYLASQSPRRSQLLDQLGVAHRPLVPTPDEDAESLEAMMGRERAEDYVQRVTLAKLQAARARCRRLGLVEAPILCADTTVVVGQTVLGKPVDESDAQRMLERLSGRSHRVCTAVAVCGGAGGNHRTVVALNVSRVRVQPLSPQSITDYIATREPFGKAGAYAIQGRFAQHVTRIEGSYSAIMGLPLFETAALLQALDVRR